MAARSRLRAIGLRLALLSGSLLVCGLVLEGVFRLFGYEPIHAVYSKPEMFWREDPLLGWALDPNVEGVYRGPRPFPIEFQAKVRTNSLGLRGPELAPLPAGGQRVMLLGDSVVAGFEVPEEEHFATLLERRLTAELAHPVQVINAGIRGYGTDQVALYYTDRGRRLAPDVVVYVASYNDPEDNTTLHRARRPFGKGALALRPDGSLERVGFPIPKYPFCSSYRLDDSFRVLREDRLSARTLCAVETTLVDHSAVMTFVAMKLRQSSALLYKLHQMGGHAQNVPGASADVAMPFRLTAALIAHLDREVQASGAEMLLVIGTPVLAPLPRALLGLPDDRILNLDRVTEGAPGPVSFKADSHFNTLGHKRLADLLAPVLAGRLRERPARSAPAAQ